MQCNVGQLLRESTGSTRSFSVDRTFVDGPEPLEIPQGQVRILRTHQGVLVTADIEVEANLTCSRCLRQFPRSSSLHIEEEYLLAAEVKALRLVDPSFGDEMDFSIDEDNIVDLTEALRQYVIADEPMKPLCRAECLGLCHLCGNDFNQDPCECGAGQMDPRWSGLAGLLKTSGD